MELECFKYKEKMKLDEAFCKHPGDYCKYRTSCMIQYLTSENKPKQEQPEPSGEEQTDKKENNAT